MLGKAAVPALQLGDKRPVSQCHPQDDEHGGKRDRDAYRPAGEVHTDQNSRQDRKVERHRQIFDHEDREDRRRLTVGETPEILQQLRNDTR